MTTTKPERKRATTAKDAGTAGISPLAAARACGAAKGQGGHQGEID